VEEEEQEETHDIVDDDEQPALAPAPTSNAKKQKRTSASSSSSSAPTQPEVTTKIKKRKATQDDDDDDDDENEQQQQNTAAAQKLFSPPGLLASKDWDPSTNPHTQDHLLDNFSLVDAAHGKQTLALRLTVPPDAKRWSINISPRDHCQFTNVLLHFNPRYKKKQLEMNDKQGTWGTSNHRTDFQALHAQVGPGTVDLVIHIRAEVDHRDVMAGHAARDRGDDTFGDVERDHARAVAEVVIAGHGLGLGPVSCAVDLSESGVPRRCRLPREQ
jgi:hypothetical protein